VDPEFKKQLRKKLWDLVQTQNGGRGPDDRSH
jgi:hypothetical protein